LLRPFRRTSEATFSKGLIPPTRLHDVGQGDFTTVGDNYLRHFIELCALRPDDRVLDIGSGTGRIARPLTTFLTDGRYSGIEVVEEAVTWCQQAYRRFPNFEFRHADVHNSVYNPGGSVRPEAYRFPFGDGAFTFAVLTSVFTHMLTAEVRNYLTELARVLVPGGRAFATFFLLDDQARDGILRGVSALTFEYQSAGCWLHSKRAPEAAVAYEEDQLRAICESAGLRVSQIRHGAWSGNRAGFDWQDVVILQR
jgi:SAM-dependent methyltransferase